MTSVAAYGKSAETSKTFEEAVYKKVTWRLIPFLILCYFFAYLDRVNVGFAKLQMLEALKFDAEIYGFGAGIFFFGYFLFEVPSNILMQRFGPRFWIARIMASWAVLSALTAFVTTPWQFYSVRFLLGVAEAGFFPGIVLYLTYWYPSWRSARALALFILVTPLSSIIGNPLSGAIMTLFENVEGLHAWQWLFIVEAVPSLLLVFAVIAYLDDSVEKAKWLTDEEKAVIKRDIEIDTKAKIAKGKPGSTSFMGMLANPYVWLLSLIFFLFNSGYYGINFWLPSIVKSLGVEGAFKIGLISALPALCGAVTMILNSFHSDKVAERRWHIAIPALVGCVGLVLSAYNTGGSPVVMMFWICFATAGTMALIPNFVSLPGTILAGTAAAAGIATVNSIGNLAGWAGPYIMGWLEKTTGSTQMGLYIFAGMLFVVVPLILSIPKQLVNPKKQSD